MIQKNVYEGFKNKKQEESSQQEPFTSKEGFFLQPLFVLYPRSLNLSLSLTHTL